MVDDVIRIFVSAVVAFWIGIAGTPLLTHYLFTYKVWKKKGGKVALDGSHAVEFGKLHAENETKTPRMGGIVIWGSVTLTATLLYIISILAPSPFTAQLDFINRSQTWIPLVAMLIGAFVGFINDVLDVVESREARGLPLSVRLAIVTLLSLFIGSWFYSKLGIDVIGVPFFPDLYVGWTIVPLFILTSLFLYASGVIDGIDGLSGGVFASIFGAYTFIAFSNGQFDLAAFCAATLGGLLAFLWFNVPPARFWMTETGTMSITLTIASVA